MKYSLLLAGAIALAGASDAFGHGVQVQLTYNATSQEIETRQIVHTASAPTSITDLTRVYVIPMLSLTGGAGDGWYVRPDDERSIFGVPLYPTGPGVTFQYDAQLGGTGWAYSGSASLPNLSGTNFSMSFVDGFKQWNGAAFVDAGIEQMQMFRGDGTAAPTITADTTDSGPFATMPLSSITSQSANSHSSIGYRLLGDGLNPGLGAGAGDDGIYLLSLQISSTAAGVGASDPIYFVLYKNQSQSSAIDAATGLGFAPAQVQVVPEPAGLMAIVVAASMFLSRRWWA